MGLSSQVPEGLGHSCLLSPVQAAWQVVLHVLANDLEGTVQSVQKFEARFGSRFSKLYLGQKETLVLYAQNRIPKRFKYLLNL